MSDEQNKKVEDKLDAISGTLQEMNLTLARQEVSLADHMRRTELLEERTEVLFNDMKPLKDHVVATNGVIKFLLGSATIAGAVFGFLKLLGKL